MQPTSGQETEKFQLKTERRCPLYLVNPGSRFRRGPHFQLDGVLKK